MTKDEIDASQSPAELQPTWPGRWPLKAKKKKEVGDREAVKTLIIEGRSKGGTDLSAVKARMEQRWEEQLKAIFENDFWQDPTKNRIRGRDRLRIDYPLNDEERVLLSCSMEEILERNKLGDLDRDDHTYHLRHLGEAKLGAIEMVAREEVEEQLKDSLLDRSVQEAVVLLGEDHARWLGRELHNEGVLYPVDGAEEGRSQILDVGNPGGKQFLLDHVNRSKEHRLESDAG